MNDNVEAPSSHGELLTTVPVGLGEEAKLYLRETKAETLTEGKFLRMDWILTLPPIGFTLHVPSNTKGINSASDGLRVLCKEVVHALNKSVSRLARSLHGS